MRYIKYFEALRRDAIGGKDMLLLRQKQEENEKEALEELQVFIDDFKDNVEDISIITDVERVYPGRDPKIRVTILSYKRINMEFYHSVDLDKANDNMDIIKSVVEHSTNFAKRCSECFELTQIFTL